LVDAAPVIGRVVIGCMAGAGLVAAETSIAAPEIVAAVMARPQSIFMIVRMVVSPD
jgi:hypothetical protein